MSNNKRWLYLGVGTILLIFCGLIYGWSLFKEPFGQVYPDWSLSQLSMTFTISMVFFCLGGFVAGKLSAKLKPKYIIMISGLLLLIGFFGVSRLNPENSASSLTMLYVTYGLLCGFGIAFAYGITIGNTVRFFPDKRGLIAGISTAAYGAGSIIFPPIMQSLIGSGGVMFTFRVLGILFGVMIIIAACFITEPPEGWMPTGWTPPAVKNSSGASAEGKNWKLMLADTRFYLMIIAFTIFATGGLRVVSQGSPMAQAIGGVDAAVAATAVSIIGLANTGGRVLWGWVSDKVGRYPALGIMAVIVAVSGFALSAFTESGSLALFLVFAMLIAMCYGGSMGVYPALTADAFGIKYNGVNYGIMFIGFALGGYIGPILANSLYDNTGSYSVPLMAVGAMGVVALIILFVLTAMKKRAQR